MNREYSAILCLLSFVVAAQRDSIANKQGKRALGGDSKVYLSHVIIQMMNTSRHLPTSTARLLSLRSFRRSVEVCSCRAVYLTTAIIFRWNGYHNRLISLVFGCWSWGCVYIDMVLLYIYRVSIWPRLRSVIMSASDWLLTVDVTAHNSCHNRLISLVFGCWSWGWCAYRYGVIVYI